MKVKVICLTRLVENSPQALPLGAACIASAIKNDPRTKEFCQVDLAAFGPEADANTITKELLKQFNTAASCDKKIACFSVFVWNRNELEEAARALKESGIISIAGGPEVTANPQSFSTFDYLVTGPGEEKVPAIIQQIVENKPAALPQAQTQVSVPSPYLDGTLNAQRYGGVLWELARGCPFKCSYCYESKGEKTIRRFPEERIRAELDLFARQNIPQVFVLDPTYNANKKQALELLNLISKKTPNTFYYFEARAEFIDQQLAQAFTKIPCSLQIGLQSSNEEVLKLVNRPFNKKQFLRGIDCLNKTGVIFGLDLIYGLPGDSLKTFKESIDFAVSQYPNNLEIFCLSVLPGTDLADRAQELHLNYQPNAPYHIINTDRFSQADIATARKLAQACSFFYNDGRAVPWFNTICRTLKLRPSAFFEEFAKSGLLIEECCDHAQIEKQQLAFITKKLTEKHLEKYTKLISDIICLNGAISRTQETGKGEKITLNYPAEYIDSQYATDLQFFLANIPPHKNSVTTFRQKNQTYWN